jgi:hypothetical protein
MSRSDLAVRKVIQAELEQRRVLDVEAKAHRARLLQLAEKRGALTRQLIAERNGVPLGLVESIAAGMPWTSDERPPAGSLPRYDPYDDLRAIRQAEAAQSGNRVPRP